MQWQEYRDEVLTDAMEAIDENAGSWDSWEECFEDLFVDDSVTGNASGSYYFSTYCAAQAVGEWIFDGEALAAFQDFGYDGIPVDKGPEALDVIARCIWLYEVASDLENYYGDLAQ